MPHPWPNTYEAFFCQATNSSYGAVFGFFSASRLPAWPAIGLLYELDFCARGHPPPWLHPTRLEVLSARAGRWQSSVGVLRGDRAMMPCPHPVLLQSLAEHRGLARECRARGRGSTRHRRRPAPAFQAPERVSNPARGLREKRPRRALACKAAAGAGLAYARDRRLPSEAREAPGSSALLPEGWRHLAIAKAT
jgi:hypothetical protein